MTHPPYLREKCRALRVERRLTIDELAERLALPRGTIYHWVRDLPLEAARRATVARRRANVANADRYRVAREQAYARGQEEWLALAADPTFRDFVCLYLAEGYKRSRNEVSVCNSDAAIMRVSQRWLLSVTDRKLNYFVQYHADQDLDEIRRFWGGALGIAPASIRLQRKSNSNQLAGRSWRSVHGVLTIRIYDTLLRARLQAWIDQLRAEWV